MISSRHWKTSIKDRKILAGRVKVCCVSGDVRAMHRDPANENALFQVASQFNLLGMTGPNVSPDEGVTRYENDRTQGRRARSLGAQLRSTETTSLMSRVTAAEAEQTDRLPEQSRRGTRKQQRGALEDA